MGLGRPVATTTPSRNFSCPRITRTSVRQSFGSQPLPDGAMQDVFDNIGLQLQQLDNNVLRNPMSMAEVVKFSADRRNSPVNVGKRKVHGRENMSNPFDSLGAFFKSNQEDAETVDLDKNDQETLDAFDKALSEKPELETKSLCAYVSYGDYCGFARSGNEAYVQNRRRDRRVKATVEVRWSQGIDDGRFQRTKIIPAGGKSYLGCTKSAHIPVTNYTYRVVGCEIL